MAIKFEAQTAKTTTSQVTDMWQNPRQMRSTTIRKYHVTLSYYKQIYGFKVIRNSMSVSSSARAPRFIQ